MNIRHVLLADAAAPNILSACSVTPQATPTAPAARTAKPAPDPPATPAAPKPTTGSAFAGSTLPHFLDSQNPLARDRSVYFGFDDYVMTPEYAPLIERHGRFLVQHPAVAIRIEGNTDERSSAAYNLALSQRRAEAVLRALKIYGFRESQMEAVRYGEEKPKSTSRDDSAWSQNRRADLAYPGR